MKILLLLSILATYPILNADIAFEILNYYPNTVFINTGIGASENFSCAIRAGFPIILLVEKNKVLFNHFNDVAQRKTDYHNTKKLLKKYDAFNLNAAFDLDKIINSYNEPITFLLGSTIPEYGTEYNNDSHILMELHHIKNHPVKTHTILVDYIHHAGTEHFHFVTLDQIQHELLSINPSYKFKFERGGYLGREPNAILVAYLP